jgi:hypothetical protein
MKVSNSLFFEKQKRRKLSRERYFSELRPTPGKRSCRPTALVGGFQQVNFYRGPLLWAQSAVWRPGHTCLRKFKTTTTVCKDYANDHRCSHSFRARTTPNGWVDEPTVSRIDEWRAHRLLDGWVDYCLILLIKP